jgi:hypothetical protein
MREVRATLTIRIRRSPASVVRLLANLELSSSWRWRLVGAAQSDPGPPRVGTRGRAWTRTLGVPLPVDVELTALDAERGVSWLSRGWTGEERHTWTVEADDADGCVVRCEARWRPTLPVWGAQRRWEAAVQDDLDHLKGWIEDGLQDDPSHAETLVRRLVRRLTWRRVAFDVRAAPVSPELVSVEIDRRHATCQMHCHFCPRTVKRDPRDLPPPDAASQDRIREVFVRALHATDVPHIALWSDDVLRYPGLFDLLDAARAQGRSVSIHTPGLDLADPAFAARFQVYDVRFDLTLHAMDHERFTAMCGNPDAYEQVLAAIQNLHDLGIRCSLATVVSDRNAGALASTVREATRRWRPDWYSIRLFYPDGDQLGRAYQRQFPSWDVINDQLRALDRSGPDRAPGLHIANLPPCQADPDALAGLTVKLTENRNALRTYRFDACASCAARSVCPGVHPAYADRFPVRPPDPARIQAVLDATVPSDAAPADAGPGTIARHRLSADLEVVVEQPRPGARYWIEGATVAVWYRIEQRVPGADRAALESRLGDVRRRWEGRALDHDTIDALLHDVRVALAP